MLWMIPLALKHRREMAARRAASPVFAPIGDRKPPDRWFHSIDLGGIVTPGVKHHFLLRGMADIAFRHGVAGKSVLDIGAWDGFYSFEAERRGAARVLSTDHFCWSGPGWGSKAGFDYAHASLLSRVESLDIDLPDLHPARIGKFDVVLFLGVLYHLPDPYAGLETAAALTDDLLVVETVTAANFVPAPVTRFYPGGLDGDYTNFWAPNARCLKDMLRDLGFRQVDIVHNPHRHPLRARHFAFASKHGTPLRPKIWP
ncbi:MAG: DUF1698 domain-containing protein [Rhodoblastus sp.]|nr:DUF1698 domain-containing protein [Rhodoblastus sp.]